MSHYYKVTDETSDRSLGYFLASSKGEARRAAIKHITAKRLDGTEIASVYQNGYGITDAATGKSVHDEGAATGGNGTERTATETQLDAFADGTAQAGG